MIRVCVLFVSALLLVAPAQGSGLMETSWYGPGFAGRPMANGERFNPLAMVAAHKTLPFGTRLRLTNPRNGRQAVVVVKDRGPFVRGRSLDVSQGAATSLGFLAQGVTTLRVEVLR
jgi:rare lipoprotein A